MDGCTRQNPAYRPATGSPAPAGLSISRAPALAGLRRVVRSGGELRFREHVRSDHARKARVHATADRSAIWPLIGGGCHSARNTLRAIERAGFELVQTRDLDVGPSWSITNPHVLGRAVR